MKDGPDVACDCGCGQKRFHNQLVEVTAERAIDQSLRTTGTVQRFWVTRECKQPFAEELAMMVQLDILVRHFSAQSCWQRLNRARTVLRLQHAIHERTRGFDYARRRAQQSAILFAVPRFLQGALARYFTKRLIHAASQEKRTTSAPVPSGSR